MRLLRGSALALALALIGPLGSTSAQVDTAYVSDRSGPTQVLGSLVNAINRREFARAYAYWEPGAAGLAPFDEFAAGYDQTLSVDLSTGPVSVDPGAGQLSYAVPTTLRSRQTDGTLQTFVGCYQLHLAQPAIQSPPFQSLAIRSAMVRQVANDADVAQLMRQVCPAVGTPLPPPAVGQGVRRPEPLCADGGLTCQYLEQT